jgi:hypothetical protein
LKPLGKLAEGHHLADRPDGRESGVGVGFAVMLDKDFLAAVNFFFQNGQKLMMKTCDYEKSWPP